MPIQQDSMHEQGDRTRSLLDIGNPTRTDLDALTGRRAGEGRHAQPLLVAATSSFCTNLDASASPSACAHSSRCATVTHSSALLCRHVPRQTTSRRVISGARQNLDGELTHSPLLLGTLPHALQSNIG